MIEYIKGWLLELKLRRIVGGKAELDRIAENARKAMEDEDD